MTPMKGQEWLSHRSSNVLSLFSLPNTVQSISSHQPQWPHALSKVLTHSFLKHQGQVGPHAAGTSWLSHLLVISGVPLSDFLGFSCVSRARSLHSHPCGLHALQDQSPVCLSCPLACGDGSAVSWTTAVKAHSACVTFIQLVSTDRLVSACLCGPLYLA